MSKSGVSKYLKLSPNEIEKVVKEEKDKWRRFRLQQVRAQAKEEAAEICKKGKQEEDLRKNILRQSLKEKWEEEQKEQLFNLKIKYQDNLRNIGEAHKNADDQRAVMKDLEKKKIQNSKLANKRGLQAMQNLKKIKNSQSEKENLIISQRQNLKSKENCRSMKIAKLPTPEKFKRKKKVTFKAIRRVEVHKAGTFTTSSYIPPSSIIQKEIPNDITAHEAAACHNREELEELKKQEQKLKEEQRKIADRGHKALKREKLKELQMHLIEELDKADQEHQLSDYLHEYTSDELSTTAEEIDNLHKKQAEKMVEELLKKEQLQLALISSRLPTILGKETPEIDKFVEENSDVYADDDYHVFQREIEEENCLHGDSDANSKKNFNVQPDIHLRETVPVHELPLIEEKFQIIKPSLRRHSSSTEIEGTANSFDPSLSEPDKEEQSISTYDTEYFDLPKSLKEKLKITEELEQKKSKNLSLEYLFKTSSDASTEYFPIPNSIPSNHIDSNDELWKNLKLLNKNSKKIKQLCLDHRLKAADDGNIKKSKLRNSPKKMDSFENKNFQTFKTPPRLYSEEIKLDGSGERPLSHKQKFEICKKEVIEHYIKRLIQMKPEDLNQLSVSSVEGSALSFPSDSNLCDFLKTSFSPYSLSSTSTSISSSKKSSTPNFATPPSSRTNNSTTVNDIDTIPVKLKSIKSDACRLSRIDESNFEASEVHSSTVLSFGEFPSSSSIVNQTMEQKVIEEVTARLQELQRMKLKILSVKQPVNCNKQKSVNEIDFIHRRPATTTDHHDGHFIIESEQRDETSYESSDAPSTYQTPSREIESDSSFPLNRSSLLTKTSPLWKLKESTDLKKQNFIQTNATMKEATQFIIQKNLNELRAVMQTSSNFTQSKTLESMSSRGSHDSARYSSKSEDKLLEKVDSAKYSGKSEEKFVEKISNIDRSSIGDKPTNESSSSASSLPDMIPILERFGITWAQSMIRKMDEADENISSDSANFETLIL